ncbi:MAG: histidine kinase [Ferruginibacter sp.]
MVSNQVAEVCQDHDGFIWIGTQTGLQRYDGKRFNTYLADIHDPNALQNDWISAVFEDSKSRLWIGTDQGAPYLFNRSTQKFYNFNLHIPPGSRKITGVWQFIEDAKGNVWLAAHDGYYKFNESTRQFESQNTLLNIGPGTMPSGISVDAAGDIWFATTGGIKKLDSKNNKVYDKGNNGGNLAVFSIKEPVGNILFDKKGNMWISTGYDSYLYRYNMPANRLTSYTFERSSRLPWMKLSQKEYLGRLFLSSNNELFVPLLSRGLAVYDYVNDSFAIINATNNIAQGLHMNMNSFGSLLLCEDRERNIWAAGDMGINIFKLDKPHFITHGLPKRNDADALPSEVSDFLQTANGDVYVSYYFENGGINQFDKDLNLKKHFGIKQNEGSDGINNQLWNLFQDNKGIIWAPNQAGTILQLDPVSNHIGVLKDSSLFGSINQVQQDAANNTWIGHQRKGLVKIDAVTKKISFYSNFKKPDVNPRRRVFCFLFDEDKIWVGTMLNGLQLFDTKTGTFLEAFLLDEKDSNSISNNNITGILSYNKDTLVIATLGGINIFDKRKKIFSTISSKDGLPNNLTQAIILDGRKNLWAAFAGGLSKINLRDHSIINYDESDGIIDNRFNNRFLQMKDGRLLVGASKSFLAFDPFSVKSNKVPPDVTITDFKVFGKWLFVDSLINTTEPVRLSYDDNSIQIEFAALLYNSSSKLKYFYQLEGIDKNWIPAGDEQDVHYSKLPSGHYIFNVKCADRDGVFCKNSTTIRINIAPPFWQRWWFTLLLSLLAIILIYIIIKWRERNIKALEAEKTKLQQLTAERYKAQFESEQISSFFSNSLFNKNDVDDVLWDVAKNLIGKLGFVDCMIYLWNDDKTRLVQKAGYGPKGSLEELEKKHFDVLPGQGVVGTVAQTGEFLIIPDTTVDQRYRVDDLERLSEICVPIKYNEQLLGVIDSEHYDRNFFTRQHLQVLNTIASLVAAKIKSIESEQRLRHQKAELADINQQLAEVQLAALRSQMNPHFIFNALNSIKKFVIANEPANAEKYLGKFSKLIRSILDNSQTGMVTIEKELQLLKLYLDLEQLRFGSKLTYAINVDEDINAAEIRIPSMIVQPFVENAMLHGIMHREDGGTVEISFNSNADWLEIIIEDNGVGRAKSAEYKGNNMEPHHSIGIEVATKRLQALKKNTNTPAGIDIIDLKDNAGEGTGTKVIISIPIQ